MAVMLKSAMLRFDLGMLCNVAANFTLFVFRRREKHQDHHLVRDLVKTVFHSSRNENNAALAYRLVFGPGLHAGSAANYVVHFVLFVR